MKIRELYLNDIPGSAHGVWLEAAPDVLRGRVASRTGDASDADVAVLEAQLDRDAGEIGWERLDAEAPLRED